MRLRRRRFWCYCGESFMLEAELDRHILNKAIVAQMQPPWTVTPVHRPDEEES